MSTTENEKPLLHQLIQAMLMCNLSLEHSPMAKAPSINKQINISRFEQKL